MNVRCLFAIAALCSANGIAAAQSGTLDQSSPATNAGFNLSAPSLTWQQQVKAGVSGQLEGVLLHVQGTAGESQIHVRVRLGPAPNQSPTVFETTITKMAPGGVEQLFIDMTGANISLDAGDVFVIETQGNDTGAGLAGSYVAPPGAPLYPEPLYLNLSSFADGGWRHGFNTYMVGEIECYADCDGNEVLNIDDFLCFQLQFALQDPYADCDENGVFNIDDFLCFQLAFALGC